MLRYAFLLLCLILGIAPCFGQTDSGYRRPQTQAERDAEAARFNAAIDRQEAELAKKRAEADALAKDPTVQRFIAELKDCAAKADTPNYCPPHYEIMDYQELWTYVGHPRHMNAADKASFVAELKALRARADKGGRCR
jgi:hypothetical protein